MTWFQTLHYCRAKVEFNLLNWVQHSSSTTFEVNLAGVDYITKNWALAMMLKTLPLVHYCYYYCWKSKMMTSVRKTLKTLVWSAQNQSISSEIFPENNDKIGRFLPIVFRWSLPENSREISPFSREIWLFLPSPIRRRRLNCLLELRDVVHKYFCSTFVILLWFCSLTVDKNLTLTIIMIRLKITRIQDNKK